MCSKNDIISRICHSSHSSNASIKQTTEDSPRLCIACSNRVLSDSMLHWWFMLMLDVERPSESKTHRSAGSRSRSCSTSDRYVPIVDFSKSSPRALKKNEITILSFIVLRVLARTNFINVDFPVPGFPLIHKKPWCSLSLVASSQSTYWSFFSNHLHVLAWAFLMVIWRASIWSNLRESNSIFLCSALSDSFSPFLS